MTKKFLWCFFLAYLFLPNAGLAVVSDKVESQRHKGVFGILIKDQSGKETFKPANTVPLVEGQAYGWVIKLSPGSTKVKWKEVFILPATPDTWGPGEASGKHKISEDRKVSITEKEVSVDDGYIQNFWNVAPGDPVGEYVIHVYVNDLLLQTFKFNVVKK